MLDELVKRYFTKHLEVHRSSASFDFVTQQADQARARIGATEEALKTLKVKTGVTSVAENSATLNADVIKIEDVLAGTESELAEQSARVKQIEESTGVVSSSKSKSGAKASPTATPHAATDEDVQTYQLTVARLNELRKVRLELLSRYTPENEGVKNNQAEITVMDRQRHELEKKFPDLIGQAPTGPNGPTTQLDLASERARLAGIQARTDILRTRLERKIKQLSEAGSQIADLERKRDLEEQNYKYFQAAVEKARVDEALDPTKMPNISTVQQPSPPKPVFGKRDKITMMLGGAGIGLSIALAVLAEMFLNRTVKRPLELESRLGAPLLLSIPYSRPMKRLKNSKKKPRGNTELMVPSNGNGAGIASWEVDHFIRPVC